jgi:serine O-acetyltransferase
MSYESAMEVERPAAATAERRRAGSMLENLRRDRLRYAELGGWYRNTGFWAGATYRFGAWSHSLPTLPRLPLLVVYWLLKSFWSITLNVHLPASARIGPGLCLIHPRNIYVPGGVDIGEDCLIFHEVTIGTGPLPPGLPTIGDHVDIYTGARVLGGIVIGDGAKVGANCVVNASVPPGAVVVPAANRVIPASLVRACGPKRRGTGGTPVPGGRGDGPP